MKMALRGRLSELMVNISPQIYRQHAIYEKGSSVLYVNLKKALYGYLILASVFYERIVADMRGKGIELNLYGPCVSNKTIKGKQMTVYWHVEYLKVSHVDPKEVTNFMEWEARGDLQGAEDNKEKGTQIPWHDA